MLVARLALAAVFVIASLSKVLDHPGTRSMVLGFGIPPRSVGIVSTALPVVELGTAALLLAPATDWWGGLAALALLAAFTVAVAANLGRGRTPDCRCFGRLGAGPIDRTVIIRNAIFAVPAVFLVIAA